MPFEFYNKSVKIRVIGGFKKASKPSATSLSGYTSSHPGYPLSGRKQTSPSFDKNSKIAKNVKQPQLFSYNLYSMKADTRITYQKRILQVQLYIQNDLYEDLSLAELAQVACFSPYHFHRVFRGMVGESVAEYIRRLRLERAAQKLAQTHQSVTDLAFEAGYETVESFTRAFKSNFGLSPSQYKKSHPTQARIKGPEFQSQGENAMQVTVKQVPPKKVAFVRHIGPYAECGAAWNKLCTWAGPQGLFQPGAQFIGLCYDDPDITPAEKIRYDACLTIDQDIEVEGEIGTQTIEGGLYAMATLQGSYTGLSNLYAQLCGQWIPSNGYEIRSLPSFEVYLNSPEETPEEDLLTDVYVPIEKL